MKKLLLSLFIVFSCASLNATIRTVSNVTNGGAQFTTIQAAIDASVSGDTVYVHGSGTTYSAFNVIDKALTIIGPGFAPDKNLLQRAVVTSCFLVNTAAPGSASGTELQGLAFINAVTLSSNSFGGNAGVNNLRIMRCEFNLGFSTI